jgi:hypothetical protein
LRGEARARSAFVPNARHHPGDADGSSDAAGVSARPVPVTSGRPGIKNPLCGFLCLEPMSRSFAKGIAASGCLLAPCPQPDGALKALRFGWAVPEVPPAHGRRCSIARRGRAGLKGVAWIRRKLGRGEWNKRIPESKQRLLKRAHSQGRRLARA